MHAGCRRQPLGHLAPGRWIAAVVEARLTQLFEVGNDGVAAGKEIADVGVVQIAADFALERGELERLQAL